MFSRILSTAFLFLSITSTVYGHAAVAPQLGVGTPRRATVLRPNNNNPCGNGVNIAATFGSSQAITANGNTFTAAVTNFNGGADGSRQVTVQIDPTGTGRNFQPATVVTNGNRAPNSVGTENVVVNLPVTCTGAGNKCLAAFRTTAGFGNCVVIQQNGAAGSNANNGNGGNRNNNNDNRNRNGNNRGGNRAAAASTAGNGTAAAGTRAARAAREAERLALEESQAGHDEDFDHDDADFEDDEE